MLYHIQIIDSLNLVQQIQQSREASPLLVAVATVAR
jgi:hypothetical protein